MFIAKRSSLMHRYLAREPGVARHYARLISVAVVAIALTALALDLAVA